MPESTPKQNLKILAIETSTNLGGVSFLQNNEILFTKSSREQKSHSELVHQFIQEGLDALKWKLSDFDIFAVSSGPGSFTGIRVAVNTGKSYAYVHKKPLIGITSLDCLAQQNLPSVMAEAKDSSGKITSIFCMINAYKNMVYYASYSITDQGELTQTHEPFVIPVKDLHTLIKAHTWVVGDGYITYEKYFSPEIKNLMHRPSKPEDFPMASCLGQLAYLKFLNEKNSTTFEWNLFTPLYLRASEAEENKKGILYSPL
jgi:tRNA threonylcarbamoyl adenosine modification protein YeaZ